jgi:hypothetical protein
MDYFDKDGDILLKLYKKTDNGILYWETWNTDNKTAVVHWGQIGETGEDRELKTASEKELRVKLAEQIENKKKEGYNEIPIDDHYTIAITFKLDSWGTPEDLDRREEIRSMLTEHLGWTGNGRCDDGDIGSGEMTLYADVVEPYIAAKTMREELRLNNVTESYSLTIMRGGDVVEANYGENM